MSEVAKSAAAREREERAIYAAWVSGLPSAERRKLESINKGLLRPLASGAMGGQAKWRSDGEAGDFAEEIGAGIGAVEINMADEEEESASAAQRRFDELMALAPAGCAAAVAVKFVRAILAEELRRDLVVSAADLTEMEEARAVIRESARKLGIDLLLAVRDAPLPKFYVRVLLMALGFSNEAESMRGLAKDYGYSVEHVSNLVEAAQRAHGLPKNQFNKSAAATATYQETNGK